MYIYVYVCVCTCMRVVCNTAACFDFIYLVLKSKDNENNTNLKEDVWSIILSISERIHEAIIYEHINISSFLQLSYFPRLIFAFSRFLF